jgi:hypothetical protein
MSKQTENRERKIELLKSAMLGIVDLLQLSKKEREWIRMSDYKELLRKVESMKQQAKPLKEIST